MVKKCLKMGQNWACPELDFALPAPSEGCIAKVKQPCLLSFSWAVQMQQVQFGRAIAFSAEQLFKLGRKIKAKIGNFGRGSALNLELWVLISGGKALGQSQPVSGWEAP